MSILAIGLNPAIDRILECPNFHVGGHQLARQVARLASGKAVNVARALAQLSCDCIATGFIGADDMEFYHEQLLATPGGRILCHFVRVGGRTRENITILDPVNRLETHIRDRGFSVTPQEIELLHQRIRHDLKPGDIAIISGSLCQGLPPDYIAQLIDLCTGLQARVVVDTNGEALPIAARQRLWILKPNVEELRQLLRADIADDGPALRDAARPLLANIELVLISRGARGAVLVTPDASFCAFSLMTDPPIRTVACGDHLLAGFVMDLAAGRPLEHALRTAIAVATARALSSRHDEFDPSLYRTALQNVRIETL